MVTEPKTPRESKKSLAMLWTCLLGLSNHHHQFLLLGPPTCLWTRSTVHCCYKLAIVGGIIFIFVTDMTILMFNIMSQFCLTIVAETPPIGPQLLLLADALAEMIGAWRI